MTDARERPTLADALPSQVPGIHWPAVVGARDAAVLSLLFQMEHSQWLSGDALRQQQAVQLDALLSHARRHCRFYRERLPQTRDWAAIPLLMRRDLQVHCDDLLADAYPKAHGKTFDIVTAGSTAEPVTVRRSALTQLFWEAATLRDHLWHRRDFSATMAIIRQFPEAVDPTRPGRWGGGVLRGGPAWHLPISTDVDAQLRWLQGVDSDILLTYPPNLEALIAGMHRDGITLPRLREVRTISGAVTPALRALCQTMLGVPLTDLYSAQEVGVIALQCPGSGLLHVQSEHLLVEVLDEQGQPCREGEVGQVVVTDLHNFAMPLIRYVLRDWAEVGRACPCGRGLPTLRRVLGRTRNMAMSPEGKLFWPVLETRRFLQAIPHLRQYQFEQTARDAITATLVCIPAPTEVQLQHLQVALEQMLGHAFRWTWQIREVPLPLSVGGKFEEFVSSIHETRAEG